MRFMDAYKAMVNEIEKGRDYSEAEHDAAWELEKAGKMEYSEACSALQEEYDACGYRRDYE